MNRSPRCAEEPRDLFPHRFRCCRKLQHPDRERSGADRQNPGAAASAPEPTDTIPALPIPSRRRPTESRRYRERSGADRQNPGATANAPELTDRIPALPRALRSRPTESRRYRERSGVDRQHPGATDSIQAPTDGIPALPMVVCRCAGHLSDLRRHGRRSRRGIRASERRARGSEDRLGRNLERRQVEISDRKSTRLNSSH